MQYPSYKEIDFSGNYELTMFNLFSITAGYHNREGMNFIIGVSGIKFENGTLNTGFLYNIPVFNNDLNITRIEIFIGYKMKNN